MADRKQEASKPRRRAASAHAAGSRSVSIGGDAVANVIQTGDGNVATLTYQKVVLPPPESVDIAAELQALEQILARLATPDQRKIANAVADAKEEIAKPNPDKNEVGKALERALDYAKKGNEFSGIVEQLAPRIANAAAWLGQNWYKLLGLVGLVI